MLNPEFDTEDFLNQYWQRKPCVIRNAIPGVVDLLDEHDLAGLAQEPDIDSRIVSLLNDKWQVSHGPFDQFDAVCTGKWTLMVQEVDRWIPDVDELAKLFSFIPYWRFDDVMVSYAVEGAGVGPHVDQYDVFLIQGKGKRRWQVGLPDQVKPVQIHQELSQVAPFPAHTDVELIPGDVLYIPPGWPHSGTSTEASITYSIGFRAPDTQDLMAPFQDTLQLFPSLQRYADNQLSKRVSPHLVESNEIDKLTRHIRKVFDSDNWDNALMAYLSDQHLPVIPPLTTLTQEQVTHHLLEKTGIKPILGCRPLYNEKMPDKIFLNGNAYCSDKHATKWILELFKSGCQQKLPESESNKVVIFQLVTKLLNDGLLFID